MLKHKTGICSQNMKVFRYFGPLLLLCLTREILHVACKTKTQKRYDHVKRLRKDSVSYSQRTKDVSENHFKRKKIPHGNNQEGPFSEGPQKGQRIFKTHFTIHNKPDLHIIGKARYKSTKPSAKDRANSARSDTTQNHLANKISNLKPDKRTKPNDSHAKKNAKKKTMVKKYSLFQSTNPVQSDSEYQPIMGGGQDFIMGNDQQGDVRDQGFSLEGQQQQAMISATNPLSQYDTGQDGQGQDALGYQQENNQPSTANFADSNYNEDAGERDGGQLSSLGQAIQFQQAGYSQQPQQQEPDEESMSQDSQGGELAGQGSQLMDAGQLQYQGEQAGQGQDQGAQEQGDQEQNDQDQTVSPNGFEQASFQQQEPHEDEQQQQPQGFEQQQQPQGFEQQQQLQDQTQEFQQQQEGPQQIQSDEQQGPEGIPTESQGLASSPNSYESLLGADGRQTGDSGQQGQGTVSYASEQSLGGSNKMAPPPGIQYASSIEEALKEPSEPTQQSQEFNSQEGDGQGGQSTNDGATSINIGPGTEAKEGGNNGLMGVGAISAPGGYQTSTVDDNGNPINPEAENGINGYASMNGQATNGETNQYEENAQPQSSPSENQNGLGVPQEQFLAPGAEPKVPPLEDDVYKVINIANKNGPTAGKYCLSCFH